MTITIRAFVSMSTHKSLCVRRFSSRLLTPDRRETVRTGRSTRMLPEIFGFSAHQAGDFPAVGFRRYSFSSDFNRRAMSIAFTSKSFVSEEPRLFWSHGGGQQSGEIRFATRRLCQHRWSAEKISTGITASQDNDRIYRKNH